MDWRNIVRPIIIIAIAVCVVVVGVHKIKDTYTGFMREYEGTEGGEVGENIEGGRPYKVQACVSAQNDRFPV